MLVHWHSPYATFIDKLVKQLRIELSDNSRLELGDENKIIANFFMSNPIFQSKGAGSVAFLSNSADLLYKFEGDRIYGDILEENLVFVVEGKLARSLDTGDGWFKALDIISKGGWLNENVLLEKRRTIISAEVLTEQATIMTIPYADMDGILKTSPQVTRTFMNHILKQMEKYQILWLQS